MAVSQDVFDQLLKAQPAPEQSPSEMLDAIQPRAETGKGAHGETQAKGGYTVLGKSGEAAGEVGAAFSKGLRSSADFFKSLIAGTVMPLIPEGDSPAAKAAWSILRPSMDFMTAEEKQSAEKPQTVVGRVLNPMAEGIGAIATMPIVGGAAPAARVAGQGLRAGVNALAERFGPVVGRNVLSGAGMGEGSDIGKNVLGGGFAAFNPEWRQTGEAVGAVLGGAAGGQLNVSRANAAYEIAKRPIQAGLAIKPAYDAARAAQAAGDERKIGEIFADQYGNLRNETKGLISEYTDRKLASSIARDIQAMTRASKFKEDVVASGVELNVPAKGEFGQDIVVKPWGLAEQTLVPALTRDVRERQPKTFEEGQDIDRMAKARQRSISDAYNNVAGDKPLATDKAAEAAGNLMRTVTQAKVDALTTEQAAAKNAFPTTNSTREFDLGEGLRTQRDTLATDSRTEATRRYTASEQAFESEGARIGVRDLRARVQEVADDFIAQVNPRGEVPPILGKLLAATKERAAPAPPDVSRQYTLTPSATVPTPQAEPVTLSLNEANDLVRTLNDMASAAIRADKGRVAYNAIQLKNEVLASIEAAPASAEAKGLYNDARAYWANEHAPRFEEGLGKALGKERGGALEGREVVQGEKVMNRIMADETGMREFDRIFGNNPEARAAAREWIEGRFRGQVLDGAKTPASFEIAVEKFKRDYDHVLSRFPTTATKIDEQSAKTLKLMSEVDGEVSRYRDVMKGPLSEAIGPLQAQRLYANVLSDPNKMDSLLASIPQVMRGRGAAQGNVAQQMVKEVFVQANPMKNGDYNAEALFNLLAAGKSDPAKQSSMEKLFAAAYGKELGQKHMKTLEALADLSLREAVTNPTVKSAGVMSESPVKEATGQTMASHIQAIRTQYAGNTGAGYAAILGLSRFANAKVQAAVEKAKMRALYDPDTAEAILEMAKTPPTKSLAATVYGRVFGNITVDDGKRFVDKLMDAGYVHSHVGRGTVYGVEKVNEDRPLSVDILTGKDYPQGQRQ